MIAFNMNFGFTKSTVNKFMSGLNFFRAGSTENIWHDHVLVHFPILITHKNT